MLEIEYIGSNSVVLKTKGGELWIDPAIIDANIPGPKKIPATQLATQADFLTKKADSTLQVEGPGEYEIGPFAISGVAAFRHTDTESEGKRSTIYRISTEDYRIGVIGNIQPKLSEEQLETLGVVDILIIPVGGGGYTLDAMNAIAIIKQVEPRVVVPVHYGESGVDYGVSQEKIDVFTKELGAPVEEMSKCKIKSSAMLPQVLTVYKISRS